MMLKDIIKNNNKLTVCEERKISKGYSEIVFYTKDANEWDKVFVSILGPALKPEGEVPTDEITSLAKEYGGIFSNQTLYKKDFDSCRVIAMFWPWQDGQHTTLKYIVKD